MVAGSARHLVDVSAAGDALDLLKYVEVGHHHPDSVAAAIPDECSFAFQKPSHPRDVLGGHRVEGGGGAMAAGVATG
jgi:hypothetical protein